MGSPNSSSDLGLLFATGYLGNLPLLGHLLFHLSEPPGAETAAAALLETSYNFGADVPNDEGRSAMFQGAVRGLSTVLKSAVLPQRLDLFGTQIGNCVLPLQLPDLSDVSSWLISTSCPTFALTICFLTENAHRVSHELSRSCLMAPSFPVRHCGFLRRPWFGR